jgi:hypothetical protein
MGIITWYIFNRVKNGSSISLCDLCDESAVEDQMGHPIRMESLAPLSCKFTYTYNCLQVVTINMEYKDVYTFRNISTVL